MAADKANIDFAYQVAIASKPAPTRFSGSFILELSDP
jgi:hypothetical protein